MPKLDESITLRLRERVENLRRELASGQEQVRLLEQRRNDLQNTLLRISGAIQVLEEMLEAEGNG